MVFNFQFSSPVILEVAQRPKNLRGGVDIFEFWFLTFKFCSDYRLPTIDTGGAVDCRLLTIDYRHQWGIDRYANYKYIKIVRLSIVALSILVLMLSSCASPPAPYPPAAPDTTPPAAPDTAPPAAPDAGSPTAPSPTPPPGDLVSKVDPLEEWWLKPQSYTYQGDPEYMLDENYTVVWWGRGLTSPEKIRTEIKAEIARYHAVGIRYIVPISLFDIEDSSDLSVIKEVSAEMIEAAVLKLDGTPLVIIENFGGDPEASQYAYDINHPGWRQYVIEQVLAAVDAGADGISIDDVNGNRWWVGNGLGSFNPASEEGFRDYLKESYTIAGLREMGIDNIDSFDYSDFLISRGWTVDTIKLGEYPGHADFPLYADFFEFQARATAEFVNLIMKRAKEYALEQYGRPVMFTECCEYRDCAARYIRPYFDLMTAGAMYGKERSFQHTVAYKLGVAVNQAPLAAWLGDTEALFSHYDIPDLYSIYIAEGYASQAQLIGHPGRGNPGQYHEFIFGHPDIFDFTNWRSEARIALLYSLTTMAGEEFYSLTHTLFFNLGQLLTDSHYQYDVVFSHGDDLTAEQLEQYQVIILPQTYLLTAREKEALLTYAEHGGKLIYIGENSEKPSPFTGGEDLAGSITCNSEWIGIADLYCWNIQHRAKENLALAFPRFYRLPSEPPPDMDLTRIRAGFESFIDSHLNKRVTLGTVQDNIGLVLWRNKDRLNLHIVNYDLDYAAGLINEKKGLSLMIDAGLFPQPSSVTVISPDCPGSAGLPFNISDGFLSFTIPKLHVWSIVVIR